MKFFSRNAVSWHDFERHSTAGEARAAVQSGLNDLMAGFNGAEDVRKMFANDTCWGLVIEEGRIENDRATLTPVSGVPQWVTVAERIPVPDRPVLLWGTKLGRDDFPVLGRLCSCHGCWIAEHAQEGDEEGVLSRLLGEVTHWLDRGTPLDVD